MRQTKLVQAKIRTLFNRNIITLLYEITPFAGILQRTVSQRLEGEVITNDKTSGKKYCKAF